MEAIQIYLVKIIGYEMSHAILMIALILVPIAGLLYFSALSMMYSSARANLVKLVIILLCIIFLLFFVGALTSKSAVESLKNEKTIHAYEYLIVEKSA